MTWRRRAPLLLIALVGAAIGISAMCNGDGGKPATQDVGSTDETPAGDPSLQHLPSAFSFTDMTDWEEASRIVGFDILRSTTFPLTWQLFTVHPSIELQGKVRRKVVAIYKVDGYNLRVTVAPSSNWRPEALESGEPLDIDRWHGRLSRWAEHSGSYTFKCGVSQDFGDVWCLVEFGQSPIETLTKFVTDLNN